MVSRGRWAGTAGEPVAAIRSWSESPSLPTPAAGFLLQKALRSVRADQVVAVVHDWNFIQCERARRLAVSAGGGPIYDIPYVTFRAECGYNCLGGMGIEPRGELGRWGTLRYLARYILLEVY